MSEANEMQGGQGVGVATEMIRVQLPGGSVREVARGTTPLEIATAISPRLASVGGGGEGEAAGGARYQPE